MEIGRVFSTSFAMFRQRFWLLLGMWLVFLVIQIAVSIALTVGVLAVGTAGALGLGAGLDDPAAITGMGIGMIVMGVVFYAGYLVILLAQQAAMVTIASPLEEITFGTAMVRGFRSALPFLALAVLMVLGLLALSLGVVALTGGSAAGQSITAVLPLLLLPLTIYLACRFAVLIPVVAVDQVFNPITALRRSWSVTRGKVVSILLTLISFVVLSIVALGLPYAMIAGAGVAGRDVPGETANVIVFAFLVFIPLLIGYTMYTSAFTAALHSEVTGGGADKLEEVFA